METERMRKFYTSGKTKIVPPSLFNVVMLNDDFTTMEFVVDILIKYFEKEHVEAEVLMMKIHNEKQAVVGTYTYDIAVTKCCKVFSEAKEAGFPLQVKVEKA